jgi:hypothetical protein
VQDTPQLFLISSTLLVPAAFPPLRRRGYFLLILRGRVFAKPRNAQEDVVLRDRRVGCGTFHLSKMCPGPTAQWVTAKPGEDRVGGCRSSISVLLCQDREGDEPDRLLVINAQFDRRESVDHPEQPFNITSVLIPE